MHQNKKMDRQHFFSRYSRTLFLKYSSLFENCSGVKYNPFLDAHFVAFNVRENFSDTDYRMI